MTKLFVNPFAECPKGWCKAKSVTDAIVLIGQGHVSAINFIAEYGYGAGLYFPWLESERAAHKNETWSSIKNLEDYEIGAREELKDLVGGSGDSIAFWLYLGAKFGLPKIECSFYETPTSTMATYVRLAEKEWQKNLSP